MKLNRKHSAVLKLFKTWDNVLNVYLSLADFIVINFLKIFHYYRMKKNFIFHMTFFGIVFVFFSVLFSCVSRKEINYNRQKLVNPYSSTNKLKGFDDKIFLKDDQLIIAEKKNSSSSGSIWGEAPRPRSLYGIEKIEKLGEVIEVEIPTDLQDDSGGTQNVSRIMLKILGKDENGNLLLSGGQAFKDANGELRRFMVSGRLPLHLQNGPTVNAKDLRDIKVEEIANGTSQTFVSTAWDKTVSRRVSGGAPDVKAATASLESEKNAVLEQKKTLEERIKSVNMERDRLAKDRQKFEELQQAKQNQNPSPPKTQNAQQRPPTAGGPNRQGG